MKNILIALALLSLTGCSVFRRQPMQKPGEAVTDAIAIGEQAVVECSWCTVIGSHQKATGRQCTVVEGLLDTGTKNTLNDPKITYAFLISKFHATEQHCGFKEGKLDNILRRRYLEK